MFFRRKANKIKDQPLKVPQHLAVIMDGNGRWAKRRGLPRQAGHKAGAETLHQFIRWSADLGIPYVTVYAFSTENWQRPKAEVDNLMQLLIDFFDKYQAELAREKVRLHFFGQLEDLPEKTLAAAREAEMESLSRDRIQVNIALSYGGRQEILQAAKLLAQDLASGKKNEKDLQVEDLANHLYLADLPDPNLLIRPGGEQRISNFLLWQLSYTELYFTPKLWPDFGRDDLVAALKEFSSRDRRFGGV